MNEIELQKYAEVNFVPIVRPKTSQLLIENVKEISPNCILEIGTAIGYSGLLMLKNSNAKLVTLEISEEMKNIATNTFKMANLEDRVNLILGDCFEYIKTTPQKFDFIFLDGPKSQYLKYYPFLLEMLNDGGRIFVDNVLFQGLVKSTEEPPKKFRTIVNNLRKFLNVVENDEKVISKLLEIEDGILIIEKNNCA